MRKSYFLKKDYEEIIDEQIKRATDEYSDFFNLVKSKNAPEIGFVAIFEKESSVLLVSFFCSFAMVFKLLFKSKNSMTPKSQ